MITNIKKWAVLTASTALFFSCTTMQLIGPTSYSGFQYTGQLKKSEMSTGIYGTMNKNFRTYDDEVVYDKDGNVLKEKQTEYLDWTGKNDRFIVWETEYKMLGGQRIPARVLCNGVPFVTVDYTIVTSKSTGAVGQDMNRRQFTQLVKPFMAQPQLTNWNIDPSTFSVPFRSDNKFVKQVEKWSRDLGFYTEQAVTLGFDNIVLTGFSYSYEKLAEGLAKSNYRGETTSMQYLSRNSVVDFKYEWTPVADKLCQTKLSFDGALYGRKTKFLAEMTYNAAGQRTKEVWTTWDYTKEKPTPVVLFEQNLSY